MRYARQEKLLDQKKLSGSVVAIVGCGGTGSAAAEYLARAGISLRLIDRDVVELTNIQRQLYRESDIGRPKAEALYDHLDAINGGINLEAVNEDLNSSNIDRLLKNSSAIVDGTDNMETRFLINDYCLKNRIPFTYGASVKGEGLFTFIIPKKSPCLRCFIPSVSKGTLDTCETAGILGPVAGLIGTISAAEVIKYLAGEKPLVGNVLHINVMNNIYETLGIGFRKDCPACKGQYEFLDSPRRDVTPLCGGVFQYLFSNELNLSFIENRLKDNKDFELLDSSKGHLLLKYNGKSITLFRNRMLVRDVFSEREVKTIGAKIIGI